MSNFKKSDETQVKPEIRTWYNMHLRGLWERLFITTVLLRVEGRLLDGYLQYA
jgi:hypothetical protein